jgi:hypothetical protein
MRDLDLVECACCTLLVCRIALKGSMQNAAAGGKGGGKELALSQESAM